jgi:hypothetical protein
VGGSEAKKGPGSDLFFVNPLTEKRPKNVTKKKRKKEDFVDFFVFVLDDFCVKRFLWCFELPLPKAP